MVLINILGEIIELWSFKTGLHIVLKEMSQIYVILLIWGTYSSQAHKGRKENGGC